MHTSHAAPGTKGHVTSTGDLPLWSLDGGLRPSLSGGGADGAYASRIDGAGAAESRRLEQEIESLRRRLATQPVIEQAKGVLMSHYHFGAEAAFAALALWSQYTNTKLYLLAGDLVDAASDHGGRLESFLGRLPTPAREVRAPEHGG